MKWVRWLVIPGAFVVVAFALGLAGGIWISTEDELISPRRVRRSKVKLRPRQRRAPLPPVEADWVDPSLQELQPAPEGDVPEGSRLVIVTWDTLRADRVGAYGYPRATTPTFDALAAQGLLFERFLVPQATTLPTHVSLFTGAHPDAHGITGNSAGGDRRFVAPEELPPIAAHLSARGYRTAGFVSSSPLKVHSGIANGFQEWSEPSGRWRSAEETSRSADMWIRRVPDDRPFLLWVHHYDAHRPYVTPEGYEDVLGDPEVLRPLLEERGLVRNGRVPDPMVNISNRYDTEVRYVDDQLQPVLQALEARGFDDAIIVVVGDHGEGLGQHRHKEHGLVWEEQLHSPFVIRAPGVEPARIPTLTTAQDLLSILAAVGDFPDEDELLLGGSGRNVLEHSEDEPVLSRISRRQLRDLWEGGSEIMTWSLHTGTHQLLYRVDGNHSLFDLTVDPFALKDVARSEPEKLSELVGEAEARIEAYQRRAAELGSGQTEALPEDMALELEALGYVE